MNEKVVPIYHRFCSSDNRVAFYYVYKPTAGEVLLSHLATKLDGTTPVAGEEVVCGSCSKKVSMYQLEY